MYVYVCMYVGMYLGAVINNILGTNEKIWKTLQKKL